MYIQQFILKHKQIYIYQYIDTKIETLYIHKYIKMYIHTYTKTYR